MPANQRKRRRKAPESTGNNNEEGKRPSPPPPAPPSLIKLLQKDKKVVEYFRALHENLTFDVQKWKERATACKEELEELKRAQTQTKQPLWSEQVKRKEQARQNESNGGAPKPAGENVVGLGTTTKEAQIDDNAFDFELSSSSEEDSDDDGGGRDTGDNRKPLPSAASGKQATNRSYKFNVDDDEDDEDDNAESSSRNNALKRKSSKQHPNPERQKLSNNRGEKTVEVEVGSGNKSIEHSSKNKPVPKHIRTGWSFLRKAEQYLNEVGIVLATAIVINENEDNIDDDDVHKDSVTNDENAQNRTAGLKRSSDGVKLNDESGDNVIESETEENESRSYTSYIRRSDSAVLGDIVRTINEWTKLKATVTFPLKSSEETETKGENALDDDSTVQRSRTLKHHYAAFEITEMIPCFVPLPDHLLGDGNNHMGENKKSGLELEFPIVPQHPAVRGVEILIQALAWIDAFGSVLDEIVIDINKTSGSESDDLDEDDIGDYYTQLLRSENSSPSKSPLSPAILFVTGMKKRCGMVRKFVKSLESEICDAWPIQDRLDRLRKLPLHDNRNQRNGTIDNNSPSESPDSVAKKFGVERRLVMDTKNSARLATLVDRCILARIVTAIYLHRSDASSAVDFLFRYLLTTVPSLQLESYPKYPPVQSLLIIETILNTPFDLNIGKNKVIHRTLFDHLLDDRLKPDPNFNSNMVNETKGSHLLFESFQLTLAASAAIFRLRISHDNPRISEPGLVEEAAYQRIASRLNRSATLLLSIEPIMEENCSLDFPFLSISKCATRLIEHSLEDLVMKGETEQTSTMLAWILPIIIIVQGDGQKLRNVFSEKLEIFLSSKSETELHILECFSKAMRQMEIRNIDSYRSVISSPITTEVKTFFQSMLRKFVDLIVTKTDNGDQIEDSIALSSLSILIRICHELADGESALRLVQWWLKCRKTKENNENLYLEGQEISSFLKHWSAFPMVRVINLERRKDRMASFLAQAMHAGLWSIRGVIPPDKWESMKQEKTGENELTCNDEDSVFTSCIGTFAIDGSQGSPAEVELKLMEWLELGGITNRFAKRELDSLVKPQWRPNDLQAFDTNASNDPNLLVPLSPSEKACALSHIATWKGIASLSITNNFTYTGFARGDPMHDPMGKIGVPPCPVALVLEDDATLVDRFQDSLDQLLEELPRDFHYCALGFARPKEAPLLDIPGCEYIKLPTMTWYLTGYLLSQAGAKYLLDKLPVVGPVDAWMGQKMILMSNWENDFGHRVGVGDAPQNGSDYVRPSLSLKEIRMCVKFRAYCARVPLCDQKVRTATATGASASHHEKPIQNWRLRDSDIVYSGNIGAKNRKKKH